MLKRQLITSRRQHGKGSAETRAAVSAYRSACHRARYAFQKSLPDMLKYSPKQFWGLLKSKDRCPPLDLASFAEFN